MTDEHARPIFKVVRQPFGKIDRAMLSAGATDADCEVIAVVTDVTREPGANKACDILTHVPHLGFRFEKGDYRRISPG